MMMKNEASDGLLRVSLEHIPLEDVKPKMKFDIDAWSRNKPYMLMRFSSTNISGGNIRDMRVYSFMDFDIGGPKSYKNDFGKFDSERGIMYVYDDTPLHVAIDSYPNPNCWTVASPTKLNITEELRDLNGTSELGPRDVAIGLQWNLGDLQNGESRNVRIIMSAAETIEDANSQLEDGWKIFDKKVP